MSKSNSFENLLMSHVFTNAAIANIGDAGGLQPSSAAGSLYISLHSADPGEAGAQNTSEMAYTNYARVGVARGTAAWTVSTNQATNAGAITFPACGATGGTITYFGVGTSAGTVAGTLLYSGSLSSSLIVSNGVTPSFAGSALTITED